MEIEANLVFDNFIEDPDDYETADDEIDDYLSPEEMEYYLEFDFNFKQNDEIYGTGEISGFYYKGIFFIHNFNVEPENEGLDAELIEYVSNLFIDLNINIEVIDIVDEELNFWEDMEEEGLLLIGNFPDVQDYYGYEENRKTRNNEDEDE
jgi:hypothetical protein